MYTKSAAYNRVGLEFEVVIGSNGTSEPTGVYGGDTLLSSIGNLSSVWKSVEDQSIGENGAEIVLRQPREYDTLLAIQINSLLSALKDRGGVKTPTTAGTHVHIDCSDLTKRELWCMITLSVLFQDLLYAMCPPHRLLSNFNVKVTPNQRWVDRVHKLLFMKGEQKQLSESVHEAARIIPANHDKYSGINLGSLAKDGRCSLEFRMFPSTLETEEVLLWVDTVVAIKNAVYLNKGVGGLSVRIEQLSDPDEISTYMLGEDLKKRIESRVGRRSFLKNMRTGWADAYLTCQLVKQCLRN